MYILDGQSEVKHFISHSLISHEPFSYIAFERIQEIIGLNFPGFSIGPHLKTEVAVYDWVV